MIILDGKALAGQILANLKKTIGTFTRPPGLAFVLVGDHPASEAYIRMKKKACQEIGIASFDQKFPIDTPEATLLSHIEALNCDPLIDGILIQQPLPRHLSTSTLMEFVDASKDVDGFHPINMGRLLLGEKNGFVACTPQGIHKLLQAYNISCQGQHAVVVGRSNIVGKPLAALLMQKNPSANATVTLAHSQTRNLKELTLSADILIAAIGKPHFIKRAFVKKGAVVIDVGINRQGNHLIGDVDFEEVAQCASHLTPVPGGVGPMTIAMLMSNTVLSFERRSR